MKPLRIYALSQLRQDHHLLQPEAESRRRWRFRATGSATDLTRSWRAPNLRFSAAGSAGDLSVVGRVLYIRRLRRAVSGSSRGEYRAPTRQRLGQRPIALPQIVAPLGERTTLLLVLDEMTAVAVS